MAATAAAVRLGKEVVGKLAVAAMPWDFTQTTSHAHMQGAESWLRPVLAAQNVLEPSHIAAYFWSLDPWGPIRRIMAYGTEADPARLAHLTALEDWLADGLALDGPIAEEMLLNWYGSNTPLKGQWQVRYPHNPTKPSNAAAYHPHANRCAGTLGMQPALCRANTRRNGAYGAKRPR
jgi:poly(3-hydroxyalkanoate) synthetase